jgi:hypothetical protein
VDFRVAVEANRARHEKAEEKRAEAEARTRLLLRAAQGFWIGIWTETQNAGVERAWGGKRRYRVEEGTLSIYPILFIYTYNHAHPCI